ncbi:MAG: DUF1080 domain-containing protein [Bacteroidota bacterium]
MKQFIKICTVVFWALMLYSCSKRSAESKWLILFNGQDLSGWDTYLGPTYDTIRNKFDSLSIPGLNNDPRKVFSVVQEDGASAIHISGDGFGGISTLTEFENFHLRVEFKWGELKWHPRKDKKRDSGILYYAVGPQGAAYGNWMRSQEFQVQEGDCGDYWSVDGSMVDVPARGSKKEEYVYDPDEPMLPFSYTSEYGRRIIKNPDAENPNGEWNVVDIYCLGDRSVHMINGKVVMELFKSRQPFEGREIPLTKGKIQIQTEGAEVYYRNIQLQPISEILL